MITTLLEGEREVVARFDRMGPDLQNELLIAVRRLSIKLQTRVKQDKLSGQVLAVRSSRGIRSIQAIDEVQSGNPVGIVTTAVDYMKGWETGIWPESAERKSLKASKAKFDVSSSSDTFKNGTPKKRPFLQPALKEMQDSGVIGVEFDAAIGRATR
jgi:hypothetical protein